MQTHPTSKLPRLWFCVMGEQGITPWVAGIYVYQIIPWV